MAGFIQRIKDKTHSGIKDAAKSALTRAQHNPGMGVAYEYLINMYADSAGKKGGEFYTTNELVKLLVALLKPHAMQGYGL